MAASALREAELIAGGFGGIVGVGAAAARDGREPALVHLVHRGAGGANARSTALVGKGITFDTGGLQIKGKSGMPGMKTDLGARRRRWAFRAPPSRSTPTARAARGRGPALRAVRR